MLTNWPDPRRVAGRSLSPSQGDHFHRRSDTGGARLDGVPKGDESAKCEHRDACCSPEP